MRKFSKPTAAVLVIVLFFTACKKTVTEPTAPKSDESLALRKAALSKQVKSQLTNNVRVFATGFNNPRGLEFGPDGYLYVAEGGTGGTNTTVGLCRQVPFPLGPVKGSPTGGRISKVSPAGVRTTVTDQLPSAMLSEITGGDIIGVADVAFIHNQLYALIEGGGCSHGNPSIPNGVVKVESNGSWSLVASISAFVQTHPVKNPEEDDFEPDGDPYSMTAVRDNLYVVEANSGQLLRITTDGNISRVVDFSALFGHIVPTVMDYKGNYYVGNLDTFPIPLGGARIMKVTPSGQVTTLATGFTTILGIVVDKRDRIYVLENTVGSSSGFPEPGKGRVVRLDHTGVTTIASGLSLPTGLTMGPDGNLYVSNWGLGPTAIGGGQVLQIAISD